MREFKFRAWENGKMYYQVRCGGMFDGEATAPTVWTDHGWVNLTGGEYTKVMQSTGYKDFEGKEIYEGDIVRFSSRESDVGTIKFGDGYFDGGYYSFTGFYAEYPSGSQGEDWNQIEEKSCAYYVVVGNIYENPELVHYEKPEEKPSVPSKPVTLEEAADMLKKSYCEVVKEALEQPSIFHRLNK